ncbi:MAG: hypothetical protein IPN46_18805 [Saprospiraceae bacterium]|nr:hypothetical protein [Saprospiraceae bacterium]
MLDSVRQLITIDSLSFENAVKKYSVKSVPSYANGGRVKNQNSNNTFFAADDLDPDTYFAIYDLKPGAISKPMLITMPDGKKAYRLIQLNSTSKPHKANLKEDFDKISNFAKESKKMSIFWVVKNKKNRDIHLY